MDKHHLKRGTGSRSLEFHLDHVPSYKEENLGKVDVYPQSRIIRELEHVGENIKVMLIMTYDLLSHQLFTSASCISTAASCSLFLCPSFSQPKQ